MLAATLLAKKRDGHELSDPEIEFLIRGFCDSTVADYQMSALAMAICLRGMTARETATLTRAMLESGARLPREVSDTRGRPRVDKHSTGGLGDKVSLVLAPLLAACGVDVPMISGRGLGLSGGTLDKLESIPGFRTDLTVGESSRILESVGAFIASASESIAPADRRLYALRDVTGTVESTALITASILSKKLAANLDALVMDVKVGQGAFMKNISDAVQLAESLVNVGAGAGLPTSVLITDMDQPLGQAVGNAVEVNESVEVLCGQGPPEVRELTVQLAANVLLQTKVCDQRDHAITRLETVLDSGAAHETFEKMVHEQGGRWDHPLPMADEHVITAPSDGFIADIDCDLIGETVVAIGGGRRRVGDAVDHSVGIRVHGRVGDAVGKGQPILTLHCHGRQKTEYLGRLSKAIRLSADDRDANPLIIRRMGSD